MNEMDVGDGIIVVQVDCLGMNEMDVGDGITVVQVDCLV